ncbi:hypothetical protein LS73_005660 [Helicobacter muridarum]|uniref:Uncharacterized protein n=1 Tax=Helicobacter muridarum TaxID=216 RepID=A0A099U0D2_9HELI|nr:hypothetical protein [Helicobacter muridarum]TLE00173.1 hypothetical protein LS73_005660 [Helicobacter muridarum]STQ87019.1 Uncharacterised protein [Helicobacter muridarum]
MVIYALLVYALMIVSIVVFCLTFYKPSYYFSNPLIKFALIIVVFILCLIPFYSGVAWLLYIVFDLPSLFMPVLCMLSLLRFFIPKINFQISYRGFIALFVIWCFISFNSLGFLTFEYADLSGEMFICACLIAIVYCIDRVLSTLLLTAFVLWLFIPSFMNTYDALFDPFVAFFGFFMQSISPSKAIYMKFSKRY